MTADDFDQGEGATPATIHGHTFEPDGDWYATCRHCGLAEAAHDASVLTGDSPLRITPDLNGTSVRRAMREAGDP